MRRSKRNIGSAYRSLPDVFEERKVKLHTHGISKNIREGVSFCCKPENLVRGIFSQMVPHVWFRLLPFDGDNTGTVVFAVGQDWEYISKLFQDVNIVKNEAIS